MRAPESTVYLVDAWLADVPFGGHRIIRAAARLAEYAHRGQKRKYTEEPYIVHPFEVATIVAPYATHEMIAAALLHDTLEDTDLPVELIADATNDLVVSHVLALTDVSCPDDGNRAARKAKDRDHIAKASGGAQSVKLADLISNTASIVKHDAAFAKVYMAEKRDLLRVLGRGAPKLYDRALAMVTEYFQKEGQANV